LRDPQAKPWRELPLITAGVMPYMRLEVAADTVVAIPVAIGNDGHAG
jgi:hypothetical protein